MGFRKSVLVCLLFSVQFSLQFAGADANASAPARTKEIAQSSSFPRVLNEPGLNEDQRLSALHPDLKNLVLDNLGVSDLNQMSLVSKELKKLASDRKIWKDMSLCFLYDKVCTSSDAEELEQTWAEFNRFSHPGERRWPWKDIYRFVRKLDATVTTYVATEKEKSVAQYEIPSSIIETVQSLVVSGAAGSLKTGGVVMGISGAPGLFLGYINLFNPLFWLFPPALFVDFIVVGCNGVVVSVGMALYEKGVSVSENQRTSQVRIAGEKLETELKQFKKSTIEEFRIKYSDVPHLKMVSSVCALD